MILIYDKKLWKCLKVIGMAAKNIELLNGNKTVKRRYYLSSIIDTELYTQSVC